MQETGNIRQNIIRGFFWKAMESGGDQLITFLISLVLARLLGPEKYGTMAIMLIFVTIANVVIQNGFQTALIQRKEVDETDLSSVFWTGLALAVFLYLVIFFSAPAIALFFADPEITAMLRVLSLILLSGSVVSVLTAMIARRMDFRLQCRATIFADLISGAAGVGAAFAGAGTWALVLQQLLKNILLMAVLMISLKWHPGFLFSAERVKSLFSYGWKVLVSGLIDTIYNNLYTPFISRLYNAAMVGYYNRGNQFPQVIVNSMAQTLQAVMLPAFSKSQEDQDRSRRMLRRSVKLSGFLMFPVMFGIMAVAEPMVLILLGEPWLPAVPLLRLCCLSYSVWHMHVINLQAINANGRSDIYLRLEVIKKICGVAVLLLSVRTGIMGMLLMKAAFDYICTLINGWPNKKLLGYSPLEQWKDALPEFILAAVMGILVYLLQTAAYATVLAEGAHPRSFFNMLVLLIVQVAAGVLLYGGASVLLKMESFRYLLESVRQLMGRRKEEPEGDA